MTESEIIAYERSFRLRRAVKNKNSLEVTFPWEVAEREAKILGLTVDQFLKEFKLVAFWGGVPGVRYTFRKIDDGK